MGWGACIPQCALKGRYLCPRPGFADGHRQHRRPSETPSTRGWGPQSETGQRWAGPRGRGRGLRAGTSSRSAQGHWLEWVPAAETEGRDLPRRPGPALCQGRCDVACRDRGRRARRGHLRSVSRLSHGAWCWRQEPNGPHPPATRRSWTPAVYGEPSWPSLSLVGIPLDQHSLVNYVFRIVSVLLGEAPFFVEDLECGLSNVHTFLATLRPDPAPSAVGPVLLPLRVLGWVFTVFNCVSSTDPSYNWRVFVLSCFTLLVLFQKKN